MDSTKQERLDSKIAENIASLREKNHTLLLATNSADYVPHVSYSPFAYREGHYYILVSDIAQHGQNLKQQPALSIMLIEDEQDAKSLYARVRLTYDATAKSIDKTSAEGRLALDELATRFGEIIDNLSKLNDFELYAITPDNGRFVKGFGQAFTIDGSDKPNALQLTEGHRK
jgi:putative heme iron utilization protein